MQCALSRSSPGGSQMVICIDPDPTGPLAVPAKRTV